MVHVLRVIAACVQVGEGATAKSDGLAKKVVIHGAGRV